MFSNNNTAKFPSATDAGNNFFSSLRCHRQQSQLVGDVVLCMSSYIADVARRSSASIAGICELGLTKIACMHDCQLDHPRLKRPYICVFELKTMDISNNSTLHSLRYAPLGLQYLARNYFIYIIIRISIVARV